MDMMVFSMLLCGFSLNVEAQSTQHHKQNSPYCDRVENSLQGTVETLRQEVMQIRKDLNASQNATGQLTTELDTAKDNILALQRQSEKDQLQINALVFNTRTSRRVIYTVENYMVEPYFNETVGLEYYNGAFFTYIMEEAAKRNPAFNFTYSAHPQFGWFITSINGLYGDTDAHLFWGFLKRFESGEVCAMDVGVSSYIPEYEGDYTVVFNYTTWDIPLPPSCNNLPHD